MESYKSILVAVDFSAIADVVIERAVKITQQGEGSLLLVHIVEYLPPLMLGDDAVASANWIINDNDLLNNARSSIQKLVERHSLSQSQQIVQMGIPKHEIVNIAQQLGVDLIVIGSHGRHGLARLLGSTATGVLHHAPCDVLAIRLQE